MKRNTFLMFTALVLLFGALINSCNGDDKNDKPGDKNQTNEFDIQNNNDEEYLRDIDDYRLETEAEFAANDSILSDFRERMQNSKKEDREKWEQEMKDLERRNEEMRAKIRDYRGEGKDKWEIFKEEFKHDMRELGEAFRNLGNDNVAD